MHLGPAIFKLSKSFPNALPAGGAYYWIQTRKNKTASVEHMLRSSGSNKQKRNSRYAGAVCMY